MLLSLELIPVVNVLNPLLEPPFLRCLYQLHNFDLSASSIAEVGIVTIVLHMMEIKPYCIYFTHVH